MIETEDLFKSIDTIVSARIQSLPYDQTLQCVIKSLLDDKLYKYLVSYQNADFIAYSNGIEYEIGTNVYVQIPQNDYRQQKYIIGKVPLTSEDLQTALAYENYIPATVNYSIHNSERIIEVNDSAENVESYTILCDYTFPAAETPAIGYDLLGLKIGIYANLPEAYEGDYGLKISIQYRDQEKYTDNISSWEQDTYYMTLDDMVNVNNYNTLGYCNQKIVINVHHKIVNRIFVQFYQKNNFKDINGTLIVGKNSKKNFFIKAKDLNVTFGYNKKDFDSDGNLLVLYTKNGLQYNNSNLNKVINIDWYRLDSDKKLAIKNTQEIRKYAYYWGRYDPATTEAFAKFLNIKSIVDLGFNNYPEIAIVLDSSRAIEKMSYYFSIPSLNLISKSLNFQNVLFSSNALDILNGLQASFTNNEYQGVYNIYKQDNELFNPAEALKLHYMILKYNAVSGNRKIQEGDTIKWSYSVGNDSMFQRPTDGEEYTGNEKTEINDIITITHRITPNDKNFNPQDSSFTLPFKISERYIPTASNNTISCTLILSTGEEYVTEKTVLFGIGGTEDFDYVFKLRMLNDEGQIVYSIPKSTISHTYIVEPSLYGYNSQILNIDDCNIEYKWMFGTPGSLVGKWNQINNNIELTISNSINLTDFNYAILQATIVYDGRELIAYLPIAAKESDNYKNIEGLTTITYDITGKKPICYKSPYKLFNSAGGQENCTWEIHYSTEPNELDGQTFTYENNIITFTPLNIYRNDLPGFCIHGKINNELVWVQPLLIIQNKYASAMKNGDANQTIMNPDLTNEKNCVKIISTMVGQVEKNTNEDKNLSGIFMGTIKEGINNSTTGFYAYRDGIPSCKIETSGYIELDGIEDGCLNINNAVINDSLIINPDKIVFDTNDKYINNNYYTGTSQFAEKFIDSNNNIQNINSIISSLQSQIDALQIEINLLKNK